jgi:hypothetical protein
MDDAHLVVTVAVDMVRRYGANAAVHLRDQAEIAAGLGDASSAQAWDDIAEAADIILRGSVPLYWGILRATGNQYRYI